MYLGDTTGDSVLFRGSTITGTNWGITPAGAATFAGSITVGTDANIDNNLTVSGGNITLGGTGRIQGVDTVSASTDATNKTYVDSNFAKRYSFDIGSSGGARRYIKLWTMTDTDDGVSGFLSMSGDYGDNDKGAYQLLVGTRGGNISMDVFETSIGGISDNFEFFYKDIGTSYEIWMLASDYNYPGQTAFLPIATFGGVTYNFDSITTTTPSGLVSVSNISFVNTVQAQSIGGAKTFTTTPISVTRSTADNSTYLATTAFVKNQGYTSNTGTITGGGQNLRLALWNGSTSIGSDGDFTYNGDTIFTTKLSVQNQINTNSANLEINYANGDGTTTNFKNFDIRDGKNAIITSFEGSTKNVTNRGNNFLIGGNFANNSYNSTSGARLLFGGGNSDSLTNYYIGTNIDNFGGSYTKLDLAWHTGIRIGAQGQYGGVRIYNNEDFSTVLFSVGSGNGETGVSVTNSLTVGAAIRTNTYQDFSGNILFLAGNTTTGASRSLNLRNSGSTSDPSSSDDSLSTGITWGQRSDSTPYYVIYPNLENWNSSGNFSKLTLAWHTGIKIGAASGYGGTRFYNNSPDVSGAAVILNVGVGNSNIGVVNNLTVGGQATGPAPTTTTSYANKAYVDGLADDDITALAFSGTTTQTLTATQRDTSTLTASFNITKIKAGGNGPSTENLNTVANSVSVGELEYRGFNSSSSNIPPVSDNANGVITVGQHSGNYNAQLAFSSDGNMYWRDNPGSSFGSWGKILDANNTPNGPFLPLAGGVMSGKIGRSSAIVGFLEGSYNNVGANGLNTNPIYTIGSSYNPASTTLSNMYGVGYTSAAASFITLTGASNWGFYVAADGDARVWLDGSNGNISAAGTIYASGGNSGQWNTHTSNTGTVTSVATGGGLDGGTITTTGTIEVEYTAVPTNIIQSGFDFTGDTVVSGDYIMISDPGQTTTNRRIGYVTVGDLPFTNNSGDITAVTAGTGMTGGGTSGSVTLNVIGGTGITANANDVAIDYAGSDSIVMAAPGGNSPDADDYIIYGADSSGGGESAKVQFIDIPLSVFDNDVGFITNSGVVLTSGTQSISGSKTFTTQVIAADFEMTAVQSRAKLSVWAGSTYGFGMQTGYTFGGLGNDYAITCQMSNTATRGFWWGDNGHSNAHGAMALTTTGLLTVASAIRLGYGEADTTSPGGTYKLDVSGNTLMNGVGVVRSSDGVGDFYLGNYATANHFRFHTNNSQTYFDMNCGQINWRDGSSIRYYFYPSTANMTINGTLTQNSDSRVKENVVEIGNCISKVQAMRGVYYNRTDFNTEVTKVGVIAQEVEAVLPELILEAPDTGLKSVAYAELTAVLINAVKEQQELIEDLKTRITKLEK
jgi:hypothetical protein